MDLQEMKHPSRRRKKFYMHRGKAINPETGQEVVNYVVYGTNPNQI